MCRFHIPSRTAKGDGEIKHQKFIKIILSIGGAIILPTLLFVFWDISAARLGSSTLLPRVSEVFDVLLHPTKDLIRQGSLLFHVYVSTVRVLMGFVIGSLLAVILGMIMGLSDKIRSFVTPFIEILRPLCPVAWIPFAIIIFGGATLSNSIGYRFTDTILDYVQIAQLFIIAWGAFFPVLINTIDGVIGVRKIWIETAKTMNASKLQIWSKVILPSSFPSILTGLKVGLGISWMVVIAAEMFPGPSGGIGYLMMEAYAQTEIHILAAGLITVGIVGALLNMILAITHRIFASWQAKER